jgi:hypothetical protein
MRQFAYGNRTARAPVGIVFATTVDRRAADMPDTQFPKPDYPKILTRKEWDKNKGALAKLHGETGLGKKMDEVERLYNGADWNKINMFEHRMTWGVVTRAAWDKVLDEAKKEVAGPLAAVSKGLYELRDLAKQVQADFKKSKTIPASSTKYVADIATQADALGVKLNKNSMSDPLRKMYDEYLAFVQTKFVDVFPAGLKKVVDKHANTITQLRKNPTASNFASLGCAGMARDFTTGLGNIAKTQEKGFAVKNGPAAQKLFDMLTPYANLQVHPTDAEVPAHVDKLEKMSAAVKAFAASL